MYTDQWVNQAPSRLRECIAAQLIFGIVLNSVKVVQATTSTDGLDRDG